MDTKQDATRAMITAFATDHGNVKELQFIRDNPEEVYIEEVGTEHGMVNYIYRVGSKDRKQSVIIKHGTDTVKADPNATISLDRQIIEYKSLKLMEEIEPGCVPKPFCLDDKYHIIAMEDMADCKLLAEQLEAGIIEKNVAHRLGCLLAKVHVATSKSGAGAERWQMLQNTFRYDNIKKECRDYFYQTPFIESSSHIKIPDGGLEAYRNCVQIEKQRGFVHKLCRLFDMEIAFLNADMHSKSIFIRDDTVVQFDFEFSFLSHPAQNVAAAVEAYIIYYHLIVNEKESTHRATIQDSYKLATTTLLESYMEGCQNLSEIEQQSFLTETALFTGGATFGSALLPDAEMLNKITDADRLTLMLKGFQLMQEHQGITSVDKFVDAIYKDV